MIGVSKVNFLFVLLQCFIVLVISILVLEDCVRLNTGCILSTVLKEMVSGYVSRGLKALCCCSFGPVGKMCLDLLCRCEPAV